jgi:aspartate/methionine/tyrosine aminotransferase
VIDSSAAFAEALLEEADVAVVSGEDFGEVAKNHIRISFACSDAQIRTGIGRIAEWVASLR